MRTRQIIATALAATALGSGMAACGTTTNSKPPSPAAHARIVKAANHALAIVPTLQQSVCDSRATGDTDGGEASFAKLYPTDPGKPTVAQIWAQLETRC